MTKSPDQRPPRRTKTAPAKSGGAARPQRLAPGLAAREAAVAAIAAVVENRRTLDDAFEAALAEPTARGIEPRDRALARLIVLTTLRRHGEIQAVLARFIERPLPARTGRLKSILASASAQLLFLDTPPHAAISLAVDQCRLDKDARHFDKLANAVLRRVATQGKEILAGLDGAALDIPAWLMERWRKAYGADLAGHIAAASLAEAPLDLSVKADAARWAETLGGELLETGSIRLRDAGRIEDLPGFAEGAWWVQDAAAALPAKLLGDVSGRDVADICAAPGGKTVALAAAGARVTAVDISNARMRRIEENLARLKLNADLVAADAASWTPGRTFDAILLDAPCTATGTIRRHPDILHLKRKDDSADLATAQRALLANAAKLVALGGTLVYCTCSLEPEEGQDRIAEFLAAQSAFRRHPIAPGEAGIKADWLTPDGDLRTLPTHGLDGFFAARLVRSD